jgi:hypothetical protein
MRVLDRVHIKGRGDVVALVNETEVAHEGCRLRRMRDGAEWPVRGVERFGKFLDLPTLLVGEKIGLLVPDGCDAAIGEDVEIVPALHKGDGT